ncbi:hypothetical protein D9758_008935 [Tetrapyrgos nigripes]|uniref:AB hydrolase-1 domain-containing protein n=1 Tax=Tetrapyrgos nigripes TaxID=182062 RepID=A0A8H5GKV5_9AGAR|nr:hypothetical protein D9758_008935 [Tetrapyrgos nigripes]
MKKQYVTVSPTSTCPFFVEAVRYEPERLVVNGFTLILLHAMNLHKETFSTLLQHLFEDSGGNQVKEAWCIDNPNSGRSSSLNQETLKQPPYRDRWLCADYANAVHSFIHSSPFSRYFKGEKLVAVGHSSGTCSIILMEELNPRINFHGIIWLDPAILPLHKRCSEILVEIFGTWAATKKHTWPNRSAASEELSSPKHIAFRTWRPELVRSFVDNAIRPVDEKNPDGPVTLSCSVHQEKVCEITFDVEKTSLIIIQAHYFAPGADVAVPPAEAFLRAIQRDDLPPIHMITCLEDEYRQRQSARDEGVANGIDQSYKELQYTITRTRWTYVSASRTVPSCPGNERCIAEA